ncbi:MAG TPA: tetratricopeptide repeat protein, partial [Stellaceae bacterium]|nr:tetratricopeptide repeat protein [Stellaceae bacterium]
MNRREDQAAATQGESGKTAEGDDAVAALNGAARAHLSSGRLLEAQLCCQQALALDGDRADTLHLMGLLCIHTKQLDHAVEWLSRAIRQEPKTLYLTTLGTALLQQGRGAEALNAFEKAIELEPGNGGLWRNLGLALAELRRNDEAILSFQHALKLEPGLWDAANKAAILLHQAARFEDALVYFNLCDELEPNNMQTVGLRSDTLQKLQRYEEALADIERVQLHDATNADACNQIGNCLAALRRYEEALFWYDRAFALGDKHALRNKAIALEQLGRLDQAMAAYRQAIAMDPDDGGAEWNLAMLQLLTGDFEAGWA